MALEEFSTLASVQARANSKRILLWTDKNKDATPDPDTLTQGFQFATSVIFEHLQKRYGETELASWTIADCPPRILSLSDDLSIWFFSSSNNSQNPLVQEIYDTAIQTLSNIRDGVSSLYGATESVTLTSATESPTDPFDNVYFNEVV